MTNAFNLKKFMKTELKKVAFYEDSRGYMNGQTRAWQNCYKQKCDQGKGPQDAWNGCLEEFQKAAKKAEWLLNYGGAKDEGKKPDFSAKTPAAQKIIK
jgi:hypothetical protein